ncbi:acetylxylan esterase [Allokutzneria sp. A3M-2-11 16]|uniref:poly(ethylene terephthalate) hydrolase family protein n=1 Tax=Allokutzneria sp. A3M-2-11 16 TaxID=2962043 RepID=UPI0020B90272|nr:acetylxylan esterase [Allokutzneria sp. A3M-2-11 16]MCP3801340.1 acetylxylan esterase [Allokutzneria sp. A3M-2-11 16]
MRTLSRIVALALTVSAFLAGVLVPASAGPAACPSVNGNWAAPGPFTVTSASNGAGTTVFRPVQLGGLGCARHPVLLWGNGAAATVASYTALLTHFASHGLIVAASEGRSGSGDPLLTGLDYLTGEDTKPGSVFAGKVDLTRVGATGHSLGGGAAIGAGADARVDTVAPLFGGPFNNPGQLHGPALFTAGQKDLIVGSGVVWSQYARAEQVPAVFAELRDAGHLATLELRGPVTAWFRWHLMGDTQARGLFYGANCGYCGTGTPWSKFERNGKASAGEAP